MIDEMQSDLKTAMLARDHFKTQVLRMVITALRNESIAKGLGPQGKLESPDALAVIKRMVKSRQDSIEQFNSVGQGERALDEKKEIDVLQTYLPAMLSEEALASAVRSLITTQGFNSPKDLGKIMKALQIEFSGNYDGKLASQLANKFLNESS